jgi:conjugative transfer signal peptidase TraF
MSPAGVLAAMAMGATLLTASALPFGRRVVYNPTPSAPLGWYAVISTGTLRVHDIVLAWLPSVAATLADQRGYLPHSVPILKEIGALEGQVVCIVGDNVAIDGKHLALTRNRDGAGRRLAPWNGCRPLFVGELFLLSNESDASFDSRYFGPIARDAVIGRAVPIWTW